MSLENIRKRFQDANLSLLEWQCNGRGRGLFRMGLILRGGSSRGLTNKNIIQTKMLSNTNTSIIWGLKIVRIPCISIFLVKIIQIYLVISVMLHNVVTILEQ